jgi:hypothetical protein
VKDLSEKEIFLFSEEADKEDEWSWLELPEIKKQDCFKYLILMKRFIKNKNMLNVKHKKWMLQNCDLPTHLIPDDVMDERSLWL